MGSHQSIRKTVAPEIPDKLYFRIGDVARLCEVPAYVLRFWETEFPQLKPNKGGTGQRLYRKRDVEMALRIKSLLYDQGYTIPGARQVFKNDAKMREAAPVFEAEPSTIAPAAPMPAIATMPGANQNRGEQIEARLRTLREEMQALVAMLGGAPIEPRTAPPARTKPLRPRLVVQQPELKNRPAATKAAPKPEAPRIPARPEAPRMKLAQRDLFGNDGSDATE
jgi:DNA-binding transcriptional MerR regulator